MNSTRLSQLIRSSALKMCSTGGSSHIGSILSCSDILAVIYASSSFHDSLHQSFSFRDHFLLSKAHAAAGLYAALAHTSRIDIEHLSSHYQDGSLLSGHSTHLLTPYIPFSGGSLGQMLSLAAGISFRKKLQNSSSHTICLLSDGELDEGSNWESLLFINHHKLYNLTIIVDRNHLQSIKSTEDTLSLEPLKSKFESFGFEVSFIDGHNHNELEAHIFRHRHVPHIIIANTVKGKGVSFMEDSVLWHYRSPSQEELSTALSELGD